MTMKYEFEKNEILNLSSYFELVFLNQAFTLYLFFRKSKKKRVLIYFVIKIIVEKYLERSKTYCTIFLIKI